MSVEVIRRKAVVVAEQHEKADASYEDCRLAETELLEAVIAVTPALPAICSAIDLGKPLNNFGFRSGPTRYSVWKGLLIGEKTYHASTDDTAVMSVHKLYIDPSNRLLLFKQTGEADPEVAPITASVAAKEFPVERIIFMLSAALDQQLRGKALKQAHKASERAAALRGIAAMLKSSKL